MIPARSSFVSAQGSAFEQIRSQRSNPNFVCFFPRIFYLVLSISSVETMPVAAKTRVFWDLGDFPIPPDCYRKFPEFPKNITKALEREGYRGDVSIRAYDNGKLPYSVFCHFSLADITFVQHTPRKITRLSRMLLDLVEWACENPPGQFVIPHEVNLLVISKDIPGGDTEFVNVLEELQRRKFNVFLVVPDDCPEEQVPLPSTATLVWRWTNLFDGKSRIGGGGDSDEDESDSD